MKEQPALVDLDEVHSKELEELSKLNPIAERATKVPSAEGKIVTSPKVSVLEVEEENRLSTLKIAYGKRQVQRKAQSDNLLGIKCWRKCQDLWFQIDRLEEDSKKFHDQRSLKTIETLRYEATNLSIQAINIWMDATNKANPDAMLNCAIAAADNLAVAICYMAKAINSSYKTNNLHGADNLLNFSLEKIGYENNQRAVDIFLETLVNGIDSSFIKCQQEKKESLKAVLATILKDYCHDGRANNLLENLSKQLKEFITDPRVLAWQSVIFCQKVFDGKDKNKSLNFLLEALDYFEKFIFAEAGFQRRFQKYAEIFFEKMDEKLMKFEIIKQSSNLAKMVVTQEHIKSLIREYKNIIKREISFLKLGDVQFQFWQPKEKTERDKQIIFYNENEEKEESQKKIQMIEF